MLSPLLRGSGWAEGCARYPRRISLPRYGSQVGLRIVLFEACSAFTRVTACTLALSPIRDTLPEGFSHFVSSIAAPVASGWSGLPGGTCTHWKAPPCHGARQKPTSGVGCRHPQTSSKHVEGCLSRSRWDKSNTRHRCLLDARPAVKQGGVLATCPHQCNVPLVGRPALPTLSRP